MKRGILWIFLLITLVGKSQNNDDLGVVIGESYYLGDINPTQHFYNPRLMFGIIYRYNYNDSYSLRVSAIHGNIGASDLDFSDELRQDRRAMFNCEYMNFALQFEYNFFSYWIPKKRWSEKTVPYLSLGLGCSINTTESAFYIPFSLGVKRVIYKNYTLGFEWTFCKTFTDKIDKLSDPMETGKRSLFMNNDWIVNVGVSLTYRFSADNVCRFFNEK